MIPESELAAIEARAEAATEGPWLTGDRGVTRREVYCPADGWVITDASESNAAFIAHARTDITALVAEVKRLRSGLASIHDWAERGVGDLALGDMAQRILEGDPP